MKKTHLALVLSTLLNEPLTCLLIWLPFILRRDCHASAWQISLLATVRPIVSIFSFYWQRLLRFRGWNHQKSVLFSGLLSRCLFLFFPWVSSIEFIIFSVGVYLFFSRAQVPSWMEILKVNLERTECHKWFSWSSMFGYAEGILLAIGLGNLFDQRLYAWKYLFLVAAILGLIGLFFQTAVPYKFSGPLKEEKISLKELFVSPILDMMNLLKTRKDFALFQWGFMSGGLGLMLVNAVCPLFFVDCLNLSHVAYGNAKVIFTGLGYLLASPFWQKRMNRMSIFSLTIGICLGFALFILSLSFSELNLVFLYLAFFIYGVSQAGSHLIWHLSGPEFSKQEDSAIFSSVNVLMVGLRGLIGPVLGSCFYFYLGSKFVFIISFSLCIFGGMLMLKNKKYSLANTLN